MRIAELRAECPGWKWRADRHGMGWRYVGERDERLVTVYAVAVLCGPAEDDFAEQWRVDDGERSETYATWWIQQAEEATR